MSVIDDKIKGLEFFQDNQDRIILELVKDIEHLVLDLNTAQLSEKGIDNQGDEIVPRYRPLTISIKKAKGQPTKRVTLKDTGGFHNSFFVVFGPKSFAIGSDDRKALKLERKYGPEIYGLIDKNIQEVIEEIRPELLNELRKII